jgi:RsiW-degrading membrane proteinase PrsW (M82 family)
MLKKIIRPFFFGIVAAAGALFFELTLSSFFSQENFLPILSTRTAAPLLATFACIEEFFKMIFIWKIAGGIERKKDVLLSALLVGLGFSLTEASLILLNGSFSGSTLYQGLIGLAVIHLSTTIFFGLFVIGNRLPRKFAAVIFFLIALFFHLVYNFLIISDAPRFILYALLSFLPAALFFLIFRAGRKYF